MNLLVVSTVSNEQEASNLTRLLLQSKVAACINIITGVKSQYLWKGKIESTNEVLVLIKTTKAKYPEVEDILKKNHSYEVPEIIAIEIEKGLTEYLNWIEQETKSLP